MHQSWSFGEYEILLHCNHSKVVISIWVPSRGQIELFNHSTVRKNDWYLIELFVLDRNTWNHLTVGSQMIHHHHHHHVMLVARISLTLSNHFSLSFIAPGRFSGQHPVSSHSCWMYVRAGRPAFARPCVGVHESTSLMSSSLLLQQCPACLARLTWIVFVIGGWWPYSWCLVGCCCQDLFKIARSILV